MAQLSVIICAHDPRADHLERVLEALRGQTLPFCNWELLLVDNASREPLAGRFSLAWHPQSRHTSEPALGLTCARLCGIARSTGEVLVFVDDDNVLAPNYLERTAQIAASHPRLGAWSGNVELEFESPPPGWVNGYRSFLVERQVEHDVLISGPELAVHEPVGAGLCVRRAVAERYREELQRAEWRRILGRRGANLMSGEDLDLALTAWDLGFTRGQFQALCLRHLIPRDRLTEEYFLRLAEGIRLSTYILQMGRDTRKAPPAINAWWWIKYWCDCATRFGRKRRFYRANKRAQLEARAFYERLIRDTSEWKTPRSPVPVQDVEAQPH